MKKTVTILGTIYQIEIRKITEESKLKTNQWAAYCGFESRRIVLADLDDEEYFEFANEEEKDAYAKECLRHEIIHAFLNESGLKDNAAKSEGPWSLNEEMVDWIAIQFPKIVKAYNELGIL